MRGVWELLDRADTTRGSRPTTYERRKKHAGDGGIYTLPTCTKPLSLEQVDAISIYSSELFCSLSVGLRFRGSKFERQPPCLIRAILVLRSYHRFVLSFVGQIWPSRLTTVRLYSCGPGFDSSRFRLGIFSGG
jgi:hypothetical protein